MSTDCLSLAKKIIAGYCIERGDDLSLFLTAPLPELQEGARLLQEHFCGKHIDFCTIINGRSGAAGRTASTVHRRPAITRASRNTPSCPRRRSSPMRVRTRKPAPTALPS